MGVDAMSLAGRIHGIIQPLATQARVMGCRRESAGARGWRPVLDGPAADQARAATAAIAASLIGSLPAGDDPTAAPLGRHVALDSGRAGVALFFAYLARATQDRAA